MTTASKKKSSKANRYLLYLDILGFSDLVKRKSDILKLYKTIDSLNVFGHAPHFKCIVFSDTLLVYSEFDFDSDKHRTSNVMWMCEFAQDLFYRLIGRDIHFRAILTIGEFEHHPMKNIQAFFGQALIDAYMHEKDVQCMGLLMDSRLVPYSNIFHTSPYDDRYHFVHVMQNLVRISYPEKSYPIPTDLILPMGTEYLHAYDLVYLQMIHKHMTDSALSPRIRGKYLATWQMIRAKCAGLLDVFERSKFDPRAICNFDWKEAMERVGTPRGFHG